MDGYLAQNLTKLKESLKKDRDVVIIVDGGEREGKSVLAQQIAYFFDPTFNLDRMTIGLKNFEDSLMNAKPGQAVVGDEMMRLMHGKSAMSKINRRLVQLLAEVGQQNLVIILVLPTFFELDKYASIWRSTSLVHVYSGDGLQRGNFSFFSKEKKKLLYLMGKKFYDYRKVKPDFFGGFSNTYVIDEEEYRKKKRKALGEREDNQVKTRDDSFRERLFKLKEYFMNLYQNIVVDHQLMNQKQFGKAAGISPKTLSNWLAEEKEGKVPISLGFNARQATILDDELPLGEVPQNDSDEALKAQGGDIKSPINL